MEKDGIKDNSQNDQKSILDSIRWWLGLSWWFSVKGKWSTVVHSSYHCCENDSHSRQSCWCITLQWASCTAWSMKGREKATLARKSLVDSETWMIPSTYALLIWCSFCKRHQREIECFWETNDDENLSHNKCPSLCRIATICHQIEHLSSHSTVESQRLKFTRKANQTFFSCPWLFFLGRDNFLRTRCQRTAKSKGQTEEKATEATSSSSHQPTLLLCSIDYFFGSFTLVFDRTDLPQTFGSWPASNDESAISCYPDFFQAMLATELEYRASHVFSSWHPLILW